MIGEVNAVVRQPDTPNVLDRLRQAAADASLPGELRNNFRDLCPVIAPQIHPIVAEDTGGPARARLGLLAGTSIRSGCSAKPSFRWPTNRWRRWPRAMSPMSIRKPGCACRH